MSNDITKIALGSITLTAIIGFIFLIILLGPISTYILFNFIAPIFNLKHISFLQAGAVYILCNLLTTGFRNNGK